MVEIGEEEDGDGDDDDSWPKLQSMNEISHKSTQITLQSFSKELSSVLLCYAREWHKHRAQQQWPITGDASTTGTQNSNLTIEEMEEKFAAYVRHDVYGTMGRCGLPWTEKDLLGMALVPVRVVLATALLVVYYLIFRLCAMFSDPNREDGQEDYANMRGWRRAVIVQSGRRRRGGHRRR
ncbi:hypothetical protein LguiA_005121 [Lonicera macranthoides]